jgi:hypothetical protein
MIFRAAVAETPRYGMYNFVALHEGGRDMIGLLGIHCIPRI